MATRRRAFDPVLTTVPRSGEMIPAADGVHWVRLRLPFRLNHVNLWVLDDDAIDGGASGVWIVDTGFDLDEARQIWAALLDGPLAGRPVNGVIATHMHPDHVGLAGWLCERANAPLLMTQADWLAARLLAVGDREDIFQSYLSAYRSMALPEATAAMLAERGDRYRSSVSRPPGRYIRLKDGMSLTIGGRKWECRTYEGHAPEHLCLLAAEDGLMIVGDQILPEITPNISVWPSDVQSDPLGSYLEALDKLALLGDDIIALPGHGVPFTGLASRAREIARHHATRLDRTVDACANGATVGDLVTALFRADLNSHEIMFAVGEALAHANRLVCDDRVRRLARDDGTFLFKAP